jgi:hypothetical protein
MRIHAITLLAGLVAMSCGTGQLPAPKTAGSAAAHAGELPAAPPTAIAASTAATTPPGDASRTWTFDGDRDGAPPAGFSFAQTGGPAGRWVVRAEADAPSRPGVLAQIDTDDTDDRYAIAAAESPPLRDMSLSVRCKPVSGGVDQACGLVFRYQDEKNYYITRANPLEGNVRLYYVKNGGRSRIASWDGAVTAGVWHELAVEVRGDHIQVSWDGKQVLDHHDATFGEAGRGGLWIKADSVTYFDDLLVAPL